MKELVFIPCEKCGAINRARIDRLNGGPVCAKCKGRLETAKPLSIEADHFDKVVLESGLPVLVDFWAPWCGPCKVMHPVLEQVAAQHVGKVLVFKLNTDQAQELSNRFGIRGIPTLILFQDGREVTRQVGAVPAQVVESIINRTYS